MTGECWGTGSLSTGSRYLYLGQNRSQNNEGPRVLGVRECVGRGGGWPPLGPLNFADFLSFLFRVGVSHCICRLYLFLFFHLFFSLVDVKFQQAPTLWSARIRAPDTIDIGSATLTGDGCPVFPARISSIKWVAK
jgi:hypothetical protein